MRCNIGKKERTIRAVIGIALIAWGINSNSYILDGIGAVILITALIGWCLPYAMCKIDTNNKDKKSSFKSNSCCH